MQTKVTTETPHTKALKSVAAAYVNTLTFNSKKKENHA